MSSEIKIHDNYKYKKMGFCYYQSLTYTTSDSTIAHHRIVNLSHTYGNAFRTHLLTVDRLKRIQAGIGTKYASFFTLCLPLQVRLIVTIKLISACERMKRQKGLQ